jgi:hypothetical protein
MMAVNLQILVLEREVGVRLIDAARKANFRALVIAGILIWITWKMIVWAEKTEFGKMLEFIRDNG